MEFPKDSEIEGPWVPVTPSKPIVTNKSPASGLNRLAPDKISSIRRSAAAWSSASHQAPACSRNGEMRTQSFIQPMQMSYMNLFVHKDPVITSDMTSLAPVSHTRIANHANNNHMMPPPSPRQNHFRLNRNSAPASSISSSNNRARQPLAPSSQYELPIPPPPNLSAPEANMTNTIVGESVVVSPATPAKFGKNMMMQNFRQSTEIIDLVDDTNMPKNIQQMVAEEAMPSFTNPGLSSNIVSSQPQEGAANAMSLAKSSLQHAEGVNQSISLNKTPQQKPKRKKHRPKVVRENKPAKAQKPVTPKPVTPRRARKIENPLQSKRKYVRKKKDLNSVDNPSEALGEDANPQNGSGSKSVRRNLNFDAEDCQASDDSAKLENMSTHIGETQAHIASSGSKLDVSSVQGRGTGASENLLCGRISVDLNSSTNQLDNKCLSIPPQTSNPPPQLSREGLARIKQLQAEYIGMLNSIISPPHHARRERENPKKLARKHNCLDTAGNNVITSEAIQRQVSSDKITDDLPKGTKRDRSLVDDAQISEHLSHMHPYSGINRGDENCSARRNYKSCPDIYKKQRIENLQNEDTTSSYSTFTSTPSGPKTVQAAQSTSKAFTFADVQRFMAYKKLRASGRISTSNQVEKIANNRQSQAPNTPLKAAVDYERASTPIKPSGHNNAGYYQPSTPLKPSEFINNPDSMSIGPQARIETLIASNQLKLKARGVEKKEDVPTTPMPSNGKRVGKEVASSITYSSHGQESLCTYSSTLHTSRNSLHLHIGSVQDCQDISNYKESVSRGSRLGTIIQYRDIVDEIVQKLSRLNINEGNMSIASQEQSAVVPYVGVGTLVPFEGKKRKPRPKVDLDMESDRVWKLLMGGEGDGEMGSDKEKWWEEERRVFRGRVDSFIARMHLIQGDRRFSKWKGSVVDSVIGVFLTQNVTDHISSSAFMSLVAKFPAQSGGNINTAYGEKINRPIASDVTNGQGKMSEQQSCASSSAFIHEAAHVDEKETTSNHESHERNIRSNALDYSDSNNLKSHVYQKINNVNSHEGELGIGRESPDSGSATAVTITSSTGRAEGEDGSSMEDIVSSQNSVASQNYSNYLVHMADRGKTNSMLNIYTDGLISGGIGNCSNSFTQLLKMASSRGLQELNGPGNGRTSSAEHSTRISQFRDKGFAQVPSIPYPSHCPCSAGTAGPSVYTSNSNFQSIQSDLMSSSCVPSLSNASPAASVINNTNGIEKRGRHCSQPAETPAKGIDQHILLASKVVPFGTYAPMSESLMQPLISSRAEIFAEMNSCCQNYAVKGKSQALNETISSRFSLSGENIGACQRRERESPCQVGGIQLGVKAQGQMGNCLTPQTCSKEHHHHHLHNNKENSLDGVGEVKPNSKKEASISPKVLAETSNSTSKAKKAKQEADKKTNFDWDSLRKQAYYDGSKKERSSNAMDSLDYEALRHADVNEIARTIQERGMNNLLAERIKEFLDRLVRDHGSIDLEWLRDVPPDKAKDYLLSMRGLGLKSVECVRLLTLNHLAFPVDTNVGRICVRLGWVPLQPLPESLQLHLLEMYPLLETIQKYIWPRLCKLDQPTLYELHYQLITFGKVFCTKSKPNCNACPMRGECKHFASAFASARLALPGPEEKSLTTTTIANFPEGIHAPVFKSIPLPQVEESAHAQYRTAPRKCEPIIEEPASPEPEHVKTLESEIEDAFFDDPDEILTVQLNMEEFTHNLQSYMQENNMGLQDGDISKALVAMAPESASIPMPKLKNVSRLRTEHQVYELPDSHPLLEGLDKRERDDPSPYLLAIWTPGETAQSTEPPKVCCNSQDTSNLCMAHNCFSCNSIREAKAQLVRGTILIPCRTAMRGSFPLNGTYFQVNEVFADHDSSRKPIDVPRNWIWNLPRRTVYFGTSVTTIFKGLTTEGVQHCFWRGFVCVRGFNRRTRSPKPLYARLHFPPTKTAKDKRTAAAAKED